MFWNRVAVIRKKKKDKMNLSFFFLLRESGNIGSEEGRRLKIMEIFFNFFIIFGIFLLDRSKRRPTEATMHHRNDNTESVLVSTHLREKSR